MIALGIDQARRSGWGLADGRQLVRWGVARSAAERKRVVELAVELAGGPRFYVLMEDHSRMSPDRLTARDKRTERAHGTAFVQRDPSRLLIGLGKAYGRWEERLLDVGHPDALLDVVDPLEWRRAMGISGPYAKTLACRMAEPLIGMASGTLTDDDLAEGIMITLFAASHGMLREQTRLAQQRAVAQARKQARGQTRLRLIEDEGEGEDS